MHPVLVETCKSLDDLADSIMASFSDDRTLNELWGWTCPVLNRKDMANMPAVISSKIKADGIEHIADDLKLVIEEIPKRIQLFKSQTLMYVFTGNAAAAASVYLSLIEWINITVNPLFGWQVLQDNKALPNQLAHRLRSLQAGLNDIVPEKEKLEKQIRLINDATSTAESLPADLEGLKEARNKVDRFSTDAAELYGKIDNYYKDIQIMSRSVQKQKDEADKLVQQCEEAYRITTTKGLAAAFDQRANRLSVTLWIWVGGLLSALIIGSLIGAYRVKLLTELASAPSSDWRLIWMHIILSVLSIGAPLWFAWLATKQISQRFRLSEDYAFKASVAKAYEGYRKEAARLDEAFEARLFSSALSRLEEAPLRLMEQHTYGSPWHELISSAQFQKALESVPELKDKFIKIAKNGIGSFKAKKGGKEIDVKENGDTGGE